MMNKYELGYLYGRDTPLSVWQALRAEFRPPWTLEDSLLFLTGFESGRRTMQAAQAA